LLCAANAALCNHKVVRALHHQAAQVAEDHGVIRAHARNIRMNMVYYREGQVQRRIQKTIGSGNRPAQECSRMNMAIDNSFTFRSGLPSSTRTADVIEADLSKVQAPVAPGPCGTWQSTPAHTSIGAHALSPAWPCAACICLSHKASPAGAFAVGPTVLRTQRLHDWCVAVP
jgi:hypothetical protein